MPARFPDRLRLPLAFEPAALAADLAAVEAAGWTEHFVKQNYDGDWSAIALRAPRGETHPLRMNPACTDFADTPVLAAAPTCAKCSPLSPAADVGAADAACPRLADQGAQGPRPRLRGGQGAHPHPGAH